MTKRFLDIVEGQQLDWLLDSATDAMIITDVEGHIILANPPALHMFGYDTGSLNDKPIEILLPERVRHGHVGLRTDYFKHPSVRSMGGGRELSGRRSDGTEFPVEVSLSPLQAARGVSLVMATIHDISARKQVEHALRKSQEDLRQLAGHLERIKEEERKRIAQEIHDELGGLLAGIKAYVSVYIERETRAGRAPEALLVDAVALADTGFQAVRRVITELRPSVLDQLGVWAALEWYASQIEKRSKLQCSCVIEETAAAIEPGSETSTMLFRVVQEALTNVVRHAKASTVSVHVATDGDDLVVRVQDNGHGIATDRQLTGESWGITGMGERARYFGGEVTISGAIDQGTCVQLRLPLERLMSE